MTALPSFIEAASRNAPVALLRIEILASGTAAPAWSTTLTTSVAVLGDWAYAVNASKSKNANAMRMRMGGSSLFRLDERGACLRPRRSVGGLGGCGVVRGATIVFGARVTCGGTTVGHSSFASLRIVSWQVCGAFVVEWTPCASAQTTTFASPGRAFSGALLAARDWGRTASGSA